MFIIIIIIIIIIIRYHTHLVANGHATANQLSA